LIERTEEKGTGQRQESEENGRGISSTRRLNSVRAGYILREETLLNLEKGGEGKPEEAGLPPLEKRKGVRRLPIGTPLRTGGVSECVEWRLRHG